MNSSRRARSASSSRALHAIWSDGALWRYRARCRNGFTRDFRSRMTPSGRRQFRAPRLPTRQRPARCGSLSFDRSRLPIDRARGRLTMAPSAGRGAVVRRDVCPVPAGVAVHVHRLGMVVQSVAQGSVVRNRRAITGRDVADAWVDQGSSHRARRGGCRLKPRATLFAIATCGAALRVREVGGSRRALHRHDRPQVGDDDDVAFKLASGDPQGALPATGDAGDRPFRVGDDLAVFGDRIAKSLSQPQRCHPAAWARHT